MYSTIDDDQVDIWIARQNGRRDGGRPMDQSKKLGQPEASFELSLGCPMAEPKEREPQSWDRKSP